MVVAQNVKAVRIHHAILNNSISNAIYLKDYRYSIRMNRILAHLLSMSAATTYAASALAQTQTLDAVCGLKESTPYELALHTSITQGGLLVKSADGTVRFTIETDEEGTQLLRTELATGDMPLSPAQLEQLGLTKEDLRSEIVFVLGEDLAIVGIKDWQAVRDKTIRVTDSLFDALVKFGQADEATAEQAKAGTAQLFATEQAVLAMYSRRIVPYLFGYGWSLSDENTIEQEVALPNPFGGDPLPAVATTSLDDDPATPHLIEYRYDQTLDPEGVSELIIEALTKLGLPIAEAEKQANLFDIDDTMLWSYDNDRQLITKSELKRTATMPGQGSRTEHYIWKLVSVDQQAE